MLEGGRKPYIVQPRTQEVVFSPEIRDKIGGNWKPLLLIREEQSTPKNGEFDVEASFAARNDVKKRLTNLALQEGVAVWPSMVAASDGGSDYHGVFVGTHVGIEKIKKIQEKAQRRLEELQASGQSLHWPEVHFFDQEEAA